jgi:hypothetical protein
MAVDDYLESEVVVATAATAALLSPRVRGVMRKGLVYGTAGVMTAGDAVFSVAKGAGRGVQRAVGRGSSTTPATSRSPASARSRSSGKARSGRTRGSNRRSASSSAHSSA